MTGRRLASRASVLPMTLIALVAACGPTVTEVPADAAVTPVARTALAGPIPPDVTEGVDPATLPFTPAGEGCVPITRPAGTMSLCWEAHREPNEADPLQDYYVLRVIATFDGATGTGARWAVVRARLVGEPSNNVFHTWPDDVTEGPCHEVPVDGHFPVKGPVQDVETLCGRTTAARSTPGVWDQRVTWQCEGCVPADQADRSVPLRQWVVVRAGTVPIWDLYGDLGG